MRTATMVLALGVSIALAGCSGGEDAATGSTSSTSDTSVMTSEPTASESSTAAESTTGDTAAPATSESTVTEQPSGTTGTAATAATRTATDTVAASTTATGSSAPSTTPPVAAGTTSAPVTDLENDLPGHYVGTLTSESEGVKYGPTYAVELEIDVAADGTFTGLINGASPATKEACLWRLQEGTNRPGETPQQVVRKTRDGNHIEFLTTRDPESKGTCKLGGAFTGMTVSPQYDLVVTWGTGAGGPIARVKKIVD